MRPVREDLKARAVIRDEALRLYAASGPEAVSLRRVAQAAGVSPALVAHHFGSKAGLRAAVDAHVVGVFEAMLSGATGDPAAFAGGGAQAVGGIAELMLTYLPADSPIPGYLRRLLLSGDPVGRDLFRRLHAVSTALTGRWTAAGILRPSPDPAVRAAFLMINDLAVVLLRDHLTDVLGVDPLSADGIRRWATDVLSAYTRGVFEEGQ
jgi:TetR/AcrR family transcriptional regulator, regulator of cefoperazone and chloramphenicol sensitivity